MTETFKIKLRIHSENELYNPFDEDNKTLSSDVTDYLYERYKEKRLRDKLEVHITSDENIDIEKLRSAFLGYCDSMRIHLSKEKKGNMIKQFWMFGIGVLFIAFGLYASDKLPALTGEIISTIGAFSMWEAASIWIVENPETASGSDGKSSSNKRRSPVILFPEKALGQQRASARDC